MSQKINRVTDPSLDSALCTLTTSRQRSVLYRLHETPEAETSFAALVNHVLRHEPASTDKQTVATDLHHRILPELTNHGWIEYDAQNKTIRYDEDTTLARLIRIVQEFEYTR